MKVVQIPDWVLTERRGKFSGYCPCGFSAVDGRSLDWLNWLMADHMESKHREDR